VVDFRYLPWIFTEAWMKWLSAVKIYGEWISLSAVNLHQNNSKVGLERYQRSYPIPNTNTDTRRIISLPPCAAALSGLDTVLSVCVVLLSLSIARDQLNSRFHGRDIFRQIDLLPWKTPISVKSVIFREF